MEIRLFAKTRDGIANAEAVYSGSETRVLAGSRIRNRIANSVRGKAFVMKILEDPSYVSKTGELLKDCIFDSPSTAAVFVTGNASNGYRVWKTKDGKTLDAYLKEKGLR